MKNSHLPFGDGLNGGGGEGGVSRGVDVSVVGKIFMTLSVCVGCR